MSLLEGAQRSFLGASVKVIVVPIVFLLALVFLTIFVVNTGFSEVTKLREKLLESRKQEAILGSKLETLQKGQQSYEQFSDLSAVAIPEKSPAAIVISQVKTLAAEAGVTITDMSLNTQPTPDSSLQSAFVELSASGELGQVFAYLGSLDSFLPITIINDASVSQSGTLVSTDVNLTSFFAPFPETLPPLTSPISDLTDEEKILLGSFASFSQPTFTQIEVVRGGPYERADLFNF